MSNNKNLHKAKQNKKDEFYTMYDDIQKELNHYTKHFKNKTILCNCDDPFESNFTKFFLMNFNYLGLKRLICTSFSGSQVANGGLFDLDLEEQGYLLDVKKMPKTLLSTDNGGGYSFDALIKYLKKEKLIKKLKGNGDFRSEECLKYLDKADIVVTNPPFSLFREFVDVLMEYKKEFLIIGNKNAITYKEIFPLIRDNKLWLGYENPGKFVLPSGNETKQVQGLCRWFTNLDIDKRHEDLILYKTYKGNEKEYPKYDNYNAINVDFVADIPKDYKGVMGVPITFLDKFNPEQFDIIGLGIANLGLEVGVKPYKPHHKKYRKEVQKKGQVDGDLYMVDEKDHPVVPYARVLIQRIDNEDK